jgi:hypothetical protein
MGLIFFPLWVAALIWAHSNAIIGRLYNGGDFNEDEEEHEAEPSLLSNKPSKTKVDLKKK